MMAKIRSPKDFTAGVIFIAFGIGAIWIGSTYALGSAARMGPGYFPRILGGLLIGLGLITMVRALRVDGPPIDLGRLKPVVIVLGSVVLFAVLVSTLGLVLSTLILIVLSSSASEHFRWKEAIVSAVILATASVLGFVKALGLQFAIWPTFLTGS